MRRRPLAVLALLATLSGCRRRAALAPGDVIYRSADGALAFEIPGGWRALEAQSASQRVAFFGPPDGPRPYSDSIGVSYYAKGSAFASPQEYAQAQALASRNATAPVPATAAGRAALALTLTRVSEGIHQRRARPRRDQIVLIPDAGGFYALVHSEPAEGSPAGDRVFARLLNSLELPRAKP